MDDERWDTIKWLLLLAVVLVMAGMAFYAMWRIDAWLPPSGGNL